MKKLIINGLIVFAVGLLTPQFVKAQGNLVVNGGFNTDASGWMTTNEFGFGYVSDKGDPGGYFFLYSSSSSLTPTISQTISNLIPGSSYIVSGNYMQVMGSSENPSFGVALNGSYLFETAEPPNSNWYGFSLDYVATSVNALLNLSSQLNGTGVSYGIDNISMKLVPEPSDSWLLLLGGVVFIYIRSRKHHSA